MKDLRIIQNRPLDSMLIVDNYVSAFGTQLANGIPILPYQGESSDSELLHLRTYLRKLLNQGDNVVEANKLVFSLDRLRQCKESTQYLQHLLATANLLPWLVGQDFDGSPAPPPSDSEST